MHIESSLHTLYTKWIILNIKIVVDVSETLKWDDTGRILRALRTGVSGVNKY